MDPIKWLQGKKTYATAAAILIVGVLAYFGHEIPEFVWAALAAVGLGFLRMGVSDGPKPADRPAKKTGSKKVPMVLLLCLLPLAGCATNAGQQYSVISRSAEAAAGAIKVLNDAREIPLADAKRASVILHKLDDALDEMKAAIVAGRPVNTRWYISTANRLLNEIIAIQLAAEAAKKEREDGSVNSITDQPRGGQRDHAGDTRRAGRRSAPRRLERHREGPQRLNKVA